MSYITDTSTPASKVIHLDSAHAHVRYLKDDEGNELTTNFLYHMNEAIVCPSHLSMICSLHTATIPYTFYNVRGASTTSVNNHLILTYFNAGTGITTTYKLVFPSGSYTAYTFINMFQSIMTGSTEFLTRPWEITNGVPQYHLYSYIPTGNPPGYYPQFTNVFNNSVRTRLDRTRLRYHVWNIVVVQDVMTLQFGDVGTTCNDLFGVRKDAGGLVVPYSPDGISASTNSDKVIDMNDEIHGLYLRTSLTTDGTLNSETGTFSNILGRIPINVNYGGVIFHTPSNSSHKLQISLPTIKMIGVKLTDDQNRLIDLNGMNWQISIQIDFVKRLDTLTSINPRLRQQVPISPNPPQVKINGRKAPKEIYRRKI